MGASGTDVMLSPAARDYFKFAVECKNVERLNIWSAWEQAVANSKKEGDPPLLVIKRNHQVPLVVMEAKDFFELLRGKNET